MNSRGAGRKKALSEDRLQELLRRHAGGEKLSVLAGEYGLSRQTLSRYCNQYLQRDSDDILIDSGERIFTVEKEASLQGKEERFVCRSFAYWKKLNQVIFRQKLYEEEPPENYLLRLDLMYRDQVCTRILADYSHRRIMVLNETDDLLHRAFGVKIRPDWEDYEYFLESRCFPRERWNSRQLLEELGLDSYDPLQIIEKTQGRMAEDEQWIRIYYLIREEVAQ